MTGINMQLEILPNNRVVVPGCEPTSAATSPTLLAAMKASGVCRAPTARLQDILDAIPGATIRFGINFNVPYKRWLVLPARDSADCGCPDDWYGIIRSLASDDTQVENRMDYCSANGMGFCPSPDFRDAPAPDPDPYVAEGFSHLIDRYTP